MVPAKPTAKPSRTGAAAGCGRGGWRRRRRRGRGSVEHAGEGRGDALFSEGEEAEREGHPDDAQEGDTAPVGAGHGAADSGKEGKGQEADDEAGKGDAVRRQAFESLCDEEERCTPNQAWEEEEGQSRRFETE